MENIVADFTISNENTINAEYSIEQDNFDCSFEIFASGVVWGAITGNITDQTDLINILNEKATISYVDTNIQSEATSRAESDTLLQNNINTLSGNLTSEINARTLADNNLQTQIDSINNAGYITKDVNDLSYYMLTTDINTALNGKQNTISDLADIRNNAENGNIAYNTIQNYGDIVSYNATYFATASQGALADTSIQPNDNITLLNNNAGYITNSALNGYATEDFVTSQGYITGIDNADVVNALGYTPYDSSNPAGYITSASLPTVNNSTITIQKNGTTVESFTLNQANNETINITVPTSAGDVNALPDSTTINDLTTTAQQNALNSGATTTNISQIATNTQAISTETLNRQNADNNLQSQIDAIVSSSDVFDIVGTYAELQAYDISTVPVNDIIKVLVDSTHNNSATYYRCIETNDVKSWSYIGSEGAYYTKSEADNKFVEQTITVNGQPLSSNVNLSATDVGALPDSTIIPTVNNSTITIQRNNATVDTFTLNQSTAKTININVPTDTSDLTNGAGYITGITSSDVTTALGFTPYNATNPNGYITSSALTPYALISSLSTVATSGLYSDLTGLPTIPTMTSQLTNNSGFITSADLPTNYLTTNTAQDVSGRKTFLGEKAIYFKQIATSNKLGFTLYNPSNTELGALEYRPNTIGSSSLLAINCPQATGGYVGFRYWGTPAVNIVAPKVATAGNYYIPTHITNGSTTVTASNTGSVNISSLLPDVSNFVTNSSLATTLANYTLSSSLATVATSGSYNDLSNKPTIPDAQVQADWDVTDTTSKAYIKNKPYIPSGVVVDQTYDGTSTNAQSGVAINGAGFLQNTATGTNSLTILGTAQTAGSGTNVGHSTSAGQYSNAFGCNAKATGKWAEAFGGNCTASGDWAIRVGHNGDASGLKSIAIGASASASADYAIQIGVGTNSTASSLQIGFRSNNNYQLLDGTTGLIPDARISTNIARTSQIPTVPTNISAFTNDSGYITGVTSSDIITALGYTPSDNTLSNVSSSSTKVIDGQWVSSYKQIDTTTSIHATKHNLGTTGTGALSYLPADCTTYDYEVFVTVYGATTASGVSHGYAYNKSTATDGQYGRISCNANARHGNNSFVLPIYNGEMWTSVGTTAFNSSFNVTLLGYRRLGTNT